MMSAVVESPESTAERIASLEKALLQDLKVMKYKQVIHPVLQEGKSDQCTVHVSRWHTNIVHLFQNQKDTNYAELYIYCGHHP